jgi:hypothetical protein
VHEHIPNIFNEHFFDDHAIRSLGNMAKKRNARRGWRGFGWDMFQLLDFARFFFHQMIAFPKEHIPAISAMESIRVCVPKRSRLQFRIFSNLAGKQKTRETRHERSRSKVPPSTA